MLYIIYGLSVDVSKRVRAYLSACGLEWIDKVSYETRNALVPPTDGILNRGSEDEVKACDYVYSVHGRLVGFTAEQIDRAVRGIGNAYLTFSSDDISFLHELKEAYGDHVVTVYAYIEEDVLKAMTELRGIPENEVKARLEMGKAIRANYLAERELFDEVVIYSGENSAFDFNSIEKQFLHILQKYKAREKELIGLPYKGNKPYIFVSYARVDTEKVLPYLRFLQRKGCRIWYDKGITPGANWRKMLYNKLNDCAQYLLFASEASVKSKWTDWEISLALDREDLSILTVRLDDARFEASLESVLKRYQQIFAKDEGFLDQLYDGVIADVIESFES